MYGLGEMPESDKTCLSRQEKWALGVGNEVPQGATQSKDPPRCEAGSLLICGCDLLSFYKWATVIQLSLGGSCKQVFRQLYLGSFKVLEVISTTTDKDI